VKTWGGREGRDGGEGWRGGMEGRDGGEGWRAGMEGRDGGEGWREKGKVKVERREGGMGGKEKGEEYDKQLDCKYLHTVIPLTASVAHILIEFRRNFQTVIPFTII